MKPTKNTFFLFSFLHLLILPIGFLTRFFYTGVLSIDDVGKIYAMISFFTILISFTNFGVAQSLKFFIPKALVSNNYNKIKLLISHSLLFQFSLMLFISFLLLFNIDFILSWYFDDLELKSIFLVFLLYYCLIMMYYSLETSFIAYGKSHIFQTVYLIKLASILFFSFGFWYIDLENLVLWFSIAWLISASISMTLFYILFFKKINLKINPLKVNMYLFKKQMGYSFYIFITSLSFLALGQADIVIITILFSFDEVAIYSNVLALLNLLTGFFTIFSMILNPVFAEEYEKRNVAYLSDIINFFYRVILFLVIPCFFVVFFLSGKLLLYIYGVEYLSGKVLLEFFALFAFLKIVFWYNIGFINSIGEAKKISMLVFFVAVVNIVLSIIFAKYFGLLGIAIVTILGWILLAFLSTKLLSGYVKFKINTLTSFKIILSNSIFFVILYIIFFIEQSLHTISKIVIFLILYALYLIIGNIIGIYKISDLRKLLPEKVYTLIEQRLKFLSFLK
jgi:O-antigen/teichoic acid export membrane protein